VDLAGAVLQLFSWGEADVLKFPWLEPPREATVAQALALLRRLGALGESGVTDLGRVLARLPVHPRLGRLLVEGQRGGHADRVALMAALLSERDPFARESDGAVPRHATSSDVLDRVEAMEEYERSGRSATPVGMLHRSGARLVLRARDQLARLVRQEAREAPSTQCTVLRTQYSALSPDEALLRSLLAAFPDRVARRREPGRPARRHGRRRGVRLAPASGVTESELFVCVDVDASQTETFVRQASAVQPRLAAA